MKMDPEIASFIWKFQYLSSIGRNANLNLSTVNGNVSMNLSVNIGTLPAPPFGPIPTFQSTPTSKSFPCQSRNGNAAVFSKSKQKRLQRRAEERRLFAAEATLNVSAEEQFLLNLAEEAEKEQLIDTERLASSTEEAGYAIFHVKVDAHEKCYDSDVIEAINENFHGELKGKKIERTNPMLLSKERMRKSTD